MVTITEVKTKKQRREFVTFPVKMYRDVPQYIPNTYDDDLQDWDPKKNPAFAYCDARCWMAYKDGIAAGRIGAIYNRRANEKWGTKRVRFSQVDFIDDAEVADALFAAVEDWARELGCDEVHGPLGFTDLDREGMLVEGFDRQSCFFTYYNYPYYIDHLTRLGYVKDVDWVENLITIPYDEETVSRWKRLGEAMLKRHKLHEYPARTRLSYLPLFKPFFKLMNTSYAPLYGTVELTDEQIRKYSMKFAPLVNPNLASFVMNEEGEMVAMGVAAPSMAKALKAHNGRYLPFGWLHILYSFFKNDTVDLLLIAVRPDYQKTGVNAIVMNKILQGCIKMGITHAETGPTLETNKAVIGQWKSFEKEQHKRRRCFVKQL